MKLTFFQSLALSRNDYDLLTETLYRFFSSIDSLFGLKSKKFSLRSRESVYIGDDAIFPSAFQYEADFAGKFKIDSKLLAGGNVKKASFSYGSSNTSVALKPFPLLDIEQSNFEVNDLFATGLSLRSAKNVARKALKGDDIINGTYGDDYLRGYKGDDVIYGGEGFDILRGGRGKDTYVYTSVDEAPGGTETGSFSESGEREVIENFQSGKDKIDFSAIEIPDELDKEWKVFFGWNYASQNSFLEYTNTNDPTAPVVYILHERIAVYIPDGKSIDREEPEMHILLDGGTSIGVDDLIL